LDLPQSRRRRWAAACVGLLVSGLVVAAFALAAVTLTATPDTVDFGSRDIDLGTSASRPSVIHNNGADPATIDGVSLEGPDADQFALDQQAGDCSATAPTVLAQDEECTVRVAFAPTETGAKSATLRVSSDVGDATVSLLGTGTQTELSASETSLSLGEKDIDDGESDPQTSVIENTGTEPIAITGLPVTGSDAADFTVLDEGVDDCNTSTSLNGGDSCNLRVVFDPSTTGARSATVTVQSDAVDDIPIALDGDGIQTELTAAPDTLPFGSQDIDNGPTATQTSTVTNTGTESVDVDAVTVGGADPTQFERLTDQGTDCTATTTLASNGTCQVRVRFNPTTTDTKLATVTIDSNAPDETIDLSGTGTQTELTPSPTALDFGDQDIDDDETAEQISTVTNTGSEPVELDDVTLGGDDADQFVRATDQGSDCTATTSLVSGASCQVRVVFDPTTTGPKSAVVTVQSDVAADVTVDLTGNGTQTELTAAPTTRSFDPQDIDDGPTAEQTSTVTNTGTQAVTLTSVALDGIDPLDFTLGTGTAGDCEAGDVLTTGQSCTLRLAFDPGSTGEKTATATVQSNADPVSVDLDGIGTQTQIAASPPTLAFGGREVGAGPSSVQESTVTNTGTEQVSVVSVDATGDTGQFERLTDQGSDCTAATTLNSGQTCKVRVRFDPTTTGDKSVTYTIDSNAPDITVTATGTGTVAELTPSPATLPFGNRDVDAGPTAAQTSHVVSSGTAPVTITTVTLGGTHPKQFQRLTGDPNDCVAGKTLQPLEECTVRATFDPSFKGVKGATVSVASNAPTVTVDLTGTGTESAFESSDDPLDEAYVTNGQVNAVAFDGSGRTYLGGTFTQIGPRTGHGVKLSQSSDVPAGGFPDVTGTIRAVVADGSGGWFIGGDFTSVGGTPRSRLAHILSSGALDSGWDPSADGRVSALALSGGQLFVGGEFASIDGLQRAFVAKVSAGSGVVDGTWNPIVNNRVAAIAVNAAGVHLGGDFNLVEGESRNRLARVTATGAGDLDELWDPDANGAVSALALAGTDVYAGGSFTTIGGDTRNRIAKLSGDSGEPDAGWNPGASAAVNTLLVSGPDLYAGGAFTTIGGQPRDRLAKLATSNGTVDGSFLPNASAPVSALALSGTDLYVAGEFAQIGGQSRNRLARVSTSSGLADAWDPDANAPARAIAVATTNVYAGGEFTSVGGSTRNRLARLEPDGTLDADWNPDANGTVSSLVVSGSSVYVGGLFTTVGGQSRDRLAKLAVADGTADATWNPGASGNVTALAVSGTTVYAGGLFLTIDGQARSRLARLTGADGDLDTAWAPAGAGGQVNALALSGTDLFVGGAFTSINGATRNRIAKLDAGGTGAVAAWDPGASSTVSALAVTGSSLYVGGFFTTIGGADRNFVALLDTGSAVTDPSWNPNANGPVRALALSAADVYAGGEFSQVSGEPHSRLAKLPKTGTGLADSGWDPGISGGNVLALAVSGDRLAAGGTFTAAGGQSSQGFALLELPTLRSAPGGLAFGEVEVADPPTGTLTSTITNPRAETITLSAVTLGGPDAGQFQRVTGDPGDCVAGTTLPQNGTCTVRARFDPTSSGAKTASISLVSNSPGIEVALTGTGAQTQLSPSPATLAFGSRDVDDGPTGAQTSTITNSGTQQIVFSGITLGGDDPTSFELLDGGDDDCTTTTILQPGQTCEVRARFAPVSIGSKEATVVIESNADTDVTVTLTGTGTQTELSRSPATLNFGLHDIDDGPTGALTSTVTNSGTETVTLTGVNTILDADQFVRLTDGLDDCAVGSELDAGETCKLREQFDPTTVGSKHAAVQITSNAALVQVDLVGSGTQTQLTAAPDSLSLGSRDIDDGPTTAQDSTVTNTGTQPVTVADVTIGGTDAGEFVRLTGQTTDCVTGKALATNETCKVRVEFDPDTVGGKTATVIVDSNAPDATIALSGTATQTRLTATPDPLAFGDRDIDDGPSSGQSATVTNTGTETVTVADVTIGGTNASDFARVAATGDCVAGTELDATESCVVRIVFDPSARGPRAATVTIDSDGPAETFALTGAGIQTELTASPATLAFGGQDIDVGPTSGETSTITNTGTEQVALDAVTLGGPDSAQFERLTGDTDDCGVTTVLDAGETCTVRARFDPESVGDKSATIKVGSNADDVVVDLTGTGTQTQLTATPASLTFGSREIDGGPTPGQTSTIKNTGTEPVTFTGITIDAGWVRLSGETGDCALTETLGAGEECDLRLAFDPSTRGAQTGSATIASNAPSTAVALSGTGIQTELTASPATLPFGSQDIAEGATDAQTSTVTNTGTESVTLSAITPGGHTDQFSRLTGDADDCTATTVLAVGEDCTVRVHFDPTTTGAKSATYTLASNAPDAVVTATGTGTLKQLTADPDSLAFDPQDIDDAATAPKTSTVENSGTVSITIASVAVSGDGQFARLTGDADDCSAGDVLAPDDTCTVRVVFDPSAVGGKTATVTIDSNAPDETIGLSGTGTQTLLSVAPDTQAFGSQDIDDSATAARESTVTNVGTEPVDVTAVTFGGSNPTQFEQVTGQVTDCTAATTLNANETCKLRLRFDPSATGSKSATVTVASNAPAAAVSLSGTGTQTQLTPSPATLAFGDRNIDEGPTDTMTSTVTNSGTESITLVSLAVTGDDAHFTRLTDDAGDCTAGDVLAANDTCTVRARFDPSATGAKSATVTIDSNAPDATVELTGTGRLTALDHSPASLAFGDRDIDDAADTKTSVVTNSGSETVTFSSIALTGDTTQFTRLTGVAGDCAADTVLTIGQTCNVRVAFDPSTTGAKSGTVTIKSDASDETIALTGDGIQTLLTRAPATLSFGAQDIDDGATNLQTSTVTNAGSETVDLDAVTVDGNSGDFVRLTDQASDCTAATSLTAGQTCELRFRFDPGTTGDKAATATVESNAADVSAALSGTGTQTLLGRSPAGLSFGSRDIDDGATAAQTSTVTNTGTEPVTISGVALTGDSSDFAHVHSAAGDCDASTVLTAGQTCALRLVFDPASTGGKSVTATVKSNAADVAVTATGTGIQTELSRSPATLAFGARDVEAGESATQSSTVTNSGTQPVTLSSVQVTGDASQFVRVATLASDCEAGDTLTAGQTCNLRYRFRPTTTGAKAATATVASNAAAVAVGLTGSGSATRLSRSTPSVAFDPRDIDDGASAVREVTITNSGSETVDLDAVTLSGTDAGQFEQATGDAADCTAATTLTANQTCKLRLRFDPSTVGGKTATATVESNAADVTVGLSGTGTQTQLSRGPASLAFGDRDIDDGPTATQEATITNVGTQAVTISALDTSAQFERLSGQPADCASGATLAAGATCKLRARFDPTSTGAKTGTVTVKSNAPDVAVDLSGTGTQTAIDAAPATLAFGSRDIDAGPTATQTSTITNTGTEPVDLDGVTVAGAAPGQFERLTGAPDDCSASITLEADEECDVRVRFDPTTMGAKSATVAVESALPDETVALTGSGIQTEVTTAPASLVFGAQDIDDGATAGQEATVTNTGSETITFASSGLTANAAHYVLLTDASDDCSETTSLAAGEACKVRTRFDPASVGAKPSSFSIDSNAGTIAIALSGTGTQTEIARAPAALAFGSQDVDAGPTAAQASTVTNSGTEPVTLSAVSVTGADAALFERLSGQATDCAAGDTLTAGETCAVRMRFDPSSTGGRTATVTVDAADPAADVSVALSGTGTQTALALDPSALAFGARDVGDGPTAAQSSTVTNTGSEPVTISSVGLGGPDASQFERLGGAGGDCDAGSTLAAGATCALRVRFDPSSAGEKSATATVAAPTGDLTVALAGTGTQPPVSTPPPPPGNNPGPGPVAVPKLVLGAGPKRARQTAGKRFRVQLSAVGGVVPRVTLTLTRVSGGRIKRMVVTNVSARRTVAFRLARKLRAGRYKVTATGPAGTQIAAVQRTYRLR
jgi:beta-propeller uncharacterized protein DUF5122/centrosomal CEP192-like protein/HYDIN/CFA65/VesB family protein